MWKLLRLEERSFDTRVWIAICAQYRWQAGQRCKKINEACLYVTTFYVAQYPFEARVFYHQPKIGYNNSQFGYNHGMSSLHL